MNVLLIDDQEKILMATKKLVNWEKLGIKEVYTAGNAQEVRRILAGKKIDIALIDIEMPGENGVELQKWIAKEYRDISCIFLTSHADFSYAQEAVRNGAFDYILQPASFEEIERVVGRCIKTLKAKRQILHKSSRYDEERADILKKHVFAMFHQKDQFAGMQEWKLDSHTSEGKWWYLPCLILGWQTVDGRAEAVLLDEMKRAGMQEDRIFCVISRLEEKEIGILLYSDVKMPDLLLLKERLWFLCSSISESTGCDLNLYLGQYATEELPRQIGKIVDYKNTHIRNRNEVYLVEDYTPLEVRKPDSALWGRWMIRRDTALVKNQMTNLLRFAEQENYLTVSYMRMLIHSFLEACSVACYEQKQNLTVLFDEEFTYEQMLGSWTSIRDLERSIDFCLRRYDRIFFENGEENAYSVQERIQEILRYLEENMDRMISRREAAKYVFLNEDYFSRMFRRETGMGYKEYVMKQKVEYAENLLKNTGMPIALVASRVGYENYTNFTQMFRKVTGVTPTDYRKKYQKTDKS